MRRALLALLVLLAAAALFAPALGNGFVNFDDDRYVTENEVVARGLSGSGVRWALSSFHASNWHPLTWLSHMLDVELFELDPRGHHATSVLLHALASALFFLFLARATGRDGPAFLAALLFALHPLRVESVAWVAERKDVLAGALLFALLVVHGAYARRGGAGRYLAGLVLLALGLSAKPMLVSAPLLLLVADRWPLARREPWSRLVLEKAPHLALAAASCVVTLVAQRASGATGLVAEVAPLVRVENALASLGSYLLELVLPVRLSPFVPHPALVEASPARALLVPCLLGAGATVLVAALAVRLRARAPAALAGFAWWLVALLPVLGLVQVGFQARADRYTYLPSAGLAFALVFTLDELLRSRARLRLVAAGAGVLALAALSIATVRQIAVWKDPQTLWTHALATSERNFLAHTNLGNLYARAGDLEHAREHYEASLEILPGKPPHDPGAAATRYNLAGVHAMQGRLADAARELEASLALDEEQAEAHTQLGRIAIDLGDDERAVRHLRRALELEPARPDAAERLAWVLATSPIEELREGAEAVELARRACQAVQFGRPEFLETFAAALAEARDFPKAVRWQSEATKLLQGPARRSAAERLERYRAEEPFRRGDRGQPR